MARFRAVTHIEATPDAVWDWLRDWDRSSRWIVGTTVEVVGDRGEGVGAKTRAVTRIAGLRLTDEMTVTRWEPPALLEVRHERKPVLGLAWFAVSPEGTGARVEWVEDLLLPFGMLGEAGARVVRAPVEWGLRKSLTNLRGLVESSS